MSALAADELSPNTSVAARALRINPDGTDTRDVTAVALANDKRRRPYIQRVFPFQKTIYLYIFVMYSMLECDGHWFEGARV